MQFIARVLRKFDRSGRWYLLVNVTPGPDAIASRKITLCRATPGSVIWRYVKNRWILWLRLEVQSFSFRLRFNRCPNVTVNIDSFEYVLAQPSATRKVILSSVDRKTPIKDSLTLVLKSDGWPSQESALENGQRFSNALKRSFVKLRVGANYGEFGPKGMIFDRGIVLFEEQSGERILNDVHGLMVYQSLPEPRFGKTTATPLVGKPESALVKDFDAALTTTKELDERDKLAFELFNSSFFQETPISRFLLLVMAIEALLVTERRSTEVQKHIRTLMDQTKDSAELSDDEKQVLMGPLGRLMRDSVQQAGRRLSQERLGTRKYDGQCASNFFVRCYDMRSRLVHGQANSELRRESESIVATLEFFVSDILSAALETDID